MDVEIIEDEYEDVHVIEDDYDVEIIEDEYQVIVISDEEDCENVQIKIEVKEILNDDTDVIPEENGASQNIASVVPIENRLVNNIKQDNTINSDTAQSRLEDSVGITMNRTVTNAITSGRHNRKRGRRKRKLSQKKFSKANESNNFNNIDLINVSSSSTSFEQASCSTNNNLPDINDFSKLQWLRPLNNLSSPSNLQIVIIDRSHPYWRIQNDKWLMVEKRLLEALNGEMIKNRDLSIGLFDGAKWQRGIKVVGCQNENAFNFIMKFINNLDKLWHGANLQAFPMSLISRHVVKGYIPPPIMNTELTLSLIKLQNPLLCTNDWSVIKECERSVKGGMDIWLSVNDQSFRQLTSVRGEIKFGINRIFLNPCK